MTQKAIFKKKIATTTIYPVAHQRNQLFPSFSNNFSIFYFFVKTEATEAMRGCGMGPCLQVEYSSGPTYFMLFTHSALHDWSSEGSASEPWLIGASRAAGPACIALPAWTEPSGAPLVLKPSVLLLFFVFATDAIKN